MNFTDLAARIPSVMSMDREERHLPPMFSSDADYATFKERHEKHKVPRADPATFKY